MKLIDKDKVAAEIERLISNGQVKLQESQESNDCESYVAWAEHIATCIKVLSLIDTLEVKEVDLEKEVDKWYNNKAPKEFENVLYSDIEKFAKHFFELGIKAQKGE